MKALNDQQFTRYSRQIMLQDIGEVGQRALLETKILIIGCGGLGTAASMYLCGAGIGQLVLADGDDVDVSNLHRQVAYREPDLGSNKASALAHQLNGINPDTRTRTVNKMLDSDRLAMEVSMADLVLDCSDNMATRQAVNLACISEHTPLISGAAIGWQGQHMLFDFRRPSPCYRCLFGQQEDLPGGNCQTGGIAGPVVGIIGNMQALAAIKLILMDSPQPAEFHQFCGNTLSMTRLAISPDPSCPACSPYHAKEAHHADSPQ
ncbi:HesA/MoeB/ThiF family protein [Veronia pacifica]|uniref:Molybdopterin-synthase adenylyltransferase MoeB n=1 Tax=Veronia pacifica TaxID=1080227 RepID=A0A1C3EJJ0_9GAMM|nr:HesA/MoeB/ThiF family protein [Veronia pacifica]ODA33398.1 molybdopterin-synthase adenylyltransferase MoeB [Veronia pacifica]